MSQLISRPLRRFALAAALTGVLAATLLTVGCAGQQNVQEEEARRDSDFHYQLAAGNWHAGEVPAAIGELQTALQLYEQNENALFLMGFIYQGRNDFAQAIRYYELALEARPGWFEVMNNLGTVHLTMENWMTAAEYFEQLIAAPTYATPGHAHNNLGWAYYNQGDYRRALEHFNMAVLFQPEHCLAQNNRGLALLAINNSYDARDAFEVAIENCDHYPEPRYQLGVLLLNSGTDTQRALELLADCVEMAGRSSLGRRCQEYLAPYGPR